MDERIIFQVAKDVNRAFNTTFPVDNTYGNINIGELEYLLLEDDIQNMITSECDFDIQTWNFYSLHGNKIASTKVGAYIPENIKTKKRSIKKPCVSMVKEYIKYAYEHSQFGFSEDDMAFYLKQKFPQFDLKYLNKYVKRMHVMNITRVMKGARIMSVGHNLKRYKLVYDGDVEAYLKNKKFRSIHTGSKILT